MHGISRGNALNNLERYEEALESCDCAIEIKPDYHYAWNGRGNALNNLERYGSARDDCAIEINRFTMQWPRPKL